MSAPFAISSSMHAMCPCSAATSSAAPYSTPGGQHTHAHTQSNVPLNQMLTNDLPWTWIIFRTTSTLPMLAAYTSAATYAHPNSPFFFFLQYRATSKKPRPTTAFSLELEACFPGCGPFSPSFWAGCGGCGGWTSGGGDMARSARRRKKGRRVTYAMRTVLYTARRERVNRKASD